MKSTRQQAASIGALLTLLSLLVGCVMFERPPAPLACDPQLVGHWIPMPGNAAKDIPLSAGDLAQVGAGCHVRLSTASGKQGQFDALGFQSGGQHYLALHPRDLDGFFNVSNTPPVKGGLPDTAVFLLNYRINEDILEIAMPDISHALQEIEQGRLPARKVDTSVYLLTGSDREMRKLLADHPALFDAFQPTSGNLRLQRVAAGKQP